MKILTVRELMPRIEKECHTERTFTIGHFCMAAFANPHAVRALCKAEGAANRFIIHHDSMA